MKKLFLLAIAILAGTSYASLLIAQPSLADSLPANSFPSNNSEVDNSNPLSPGSSNFNMFDLIHRANFGEINWDAKQQNEKLDEAAEAFKKMQQQRFQNSQGNVTPSSPSNQPSPNQPAPSN